MRIETNVKKKMFEIPVKSEDGNIFVLHIEAETETAARMLIPKNYRIVEKDEVV